MGGPQGIQPMLVEELVGHSLMIGSTASTAAALATAEDAPQAASDPTVKRREGGAVRMLEVAEPASQCGIDRADDDRQARAVVAFRFRADRVFEFLQALLPHEATMLHEAVAQEIKTRDAHVHDFGFGRMQCQAVVGRPLLDQCQGSVRVLLRAA